MMADDLKPCPFCGSTNLVGSLDVGICMDHEDCGAPVGVVATLYCDECGCQIHAKVPLEDARSADANAKVFEKWNRRAKRTCRMTDTHWDDGQCTWGCVCSACDAHLEHEVGRYMNYCPNCGAKVVG